MRTTIDETQHIRWVSQRSTQPKKKVLIQEKTGFSVTTLNQLTPKISLTSA